MCYSTTKMKKATINRKAVELLDNGKIAARVRELQGELKKSSDIRKEWILEELSTIVFSDIRDYVTFDGKRVAFKPFNKLTTKQAKAIESIKQNRQGIELKLHGKSWSIERICKMLGFDAPQKMENIVSITNELENLSDEELEDIIRNGKPDTRQESQGRD
jgi:hypothetical protein